MSSTIALSRKIAVALTAATALVAALAVSVANSPDAAAAPAAQKNIVGTAASAGQFKTLLSLAKQAGLVGALSGTGPLTVFAPTDAAFKAVPKATLQKLANDKAALRRVLLYHVVKGNVTAARVVKLRSTKTLAGPRISIRVRSGSVFLNTSTKVLKADIGASNGTIHVVNKVLLPPVK
jgi:uncharacterized surface protein with fasciclin (FAS1) repeats